MTAFDRFDPFERRITEAIDEIAVARVPDYLNDVLQLTARSSQRPRWSFPERWFNVDTAFARPAFARRVPVRSLLILALVGLLAAVALAAYVGSRHRVPLPFGPAANGDLLYPVGGDIYARDPSTGAQHLVIGAAGEQFAASYSPNGEAITYVTSSAEGDHFMAARADGSNPQQLALIPSSGNATAAWAPDSRSVAFIYDVGGYPELSIVSLSGGTSVIALDGIIPLDVAYAPPNGDRLLLRAHEVGSQRVGLYTMNLDGSDRKTIVEPAETSYGIQYTRSGAVFSPDGKTIAYNGIDSVKMPSGEVVARFRVHLMNADGTNNRPVPAPDDPSVEENWPVFSPDGSSLLVLRWTSPNGVIGANGWIATMPADGSQKARDLGSHFTDQTDTLISKSWSPDGSRILVVVASKHQVYSADPVSGGFELLPWTTELPDWQRLAIP
jgi:Tol biopolymer transport system component